MRKIKIKRIYDNPSSDDGCRFLVDRDWPMGVSKENAKLDYWNKELAPTTKLRKWFDHDPAKFDEFAKKYRKELEDKTEALKDIRNKAKDKTVTLLCGAKDTGHNQAVVLQTVLKK